LVDLALHSSDQGRGKELVQELFQEPYIKRKGANAYVLKNDPYSQAQAAYRLESVCGYTRLQIETTLSRFEQKGGFDYYDEQREEILDSLNDW
jgi:hypothetical protein